MSNPGPAAADLAELRERLKWSFLLRVLIVSVLAVLLLLFFRVGSESFARKTIWSGVLVATGYLHALLGLLILDRTRHTTLLCYAGIGFDLVWVSLCLFLTGGAQSPFPFLYNLIVLNGSVLLLRKGAFGTALFATLSYGIVDTISPGGAGMDRLLPFLIHVSSFFSIALLGGYLADRMSEAHRLLEKRSVEYDQLVRFKDALVQNLDCGILLIDSKGTVSFVNQAAEQMLGLKAAEVMGFSLSGAVPELKAGDGASSLPVSGETVLEKAGSRKSLAYSFVPVSGSSPGGQGNLLVLQDITEIRRREEEGQREEELKRKLRQERSPKEEAEFPEIVGRSPEMKRVFALIQKTARVSSNLFIIGESGTGKELVARAVHRQSLRSPERFVAVNCGAIPENLIESELFGHVRGAFTGAVVDRPGLFLDADGGTIFLDEVGELPLHLQVKLLRVLQERTVTPVGGNRSTRVDVRVISSTNRDLQDEVQKGRFREDLYYRLDVIRITLPPLRERREDVPFLVNHFVKLYSGPRTLQISPKALGLLMDYSYPGNVRELENIIEHACVLTSSALIEAEDLTEAVRRKLTLEVDQPRPLSQAKTLVEVEREHIYKVLVITGWRIRGAKGAAVMLGMKPTTLASRLKALGLQRPSPPVFRRSDDISSA